MDVAPEVDLSKVRVAVEIQDHPDIPSAMRMPYQFEIKGKQETAYVQLNARARNFDKSPTVVVKELKDKMRDSLGVLLDTGKLKYESDWVPVARDEGRDYQEMFKRDPEGTATLMVLEQLGNQSSMEASYDNDFSPYERKNVLLALKSAESALKDVEIPAIAEELKKRSESTYTKLDQNRRFWDTDSQDALNIGLQLDNDDVKALKDARKSVRVKMFGRAGADVLSQNDEGVSLDVMDNVFPKDQTVLNEFSRLDGITDRQGKKIIVNIRTELSSDGKLMRTVRETDSLGMEKSVTLKGSEKKIMVSEEDLVMGQVKQKEGYFKDLRYLSEGGNNAGFQQEFTKWLRVDFKRQQEKKVS